MKANIIMNIRCWVMLTVLCGVTAESLAGEGQLDNSSALSKFTALEVEGQKAVNSVQRKASAVAFYLLTKQASESTSLTDDVRLTVAISAVKALDAYIRTDLIDEPTSILNEFSNTSCAKAAVFLLDESMKTLSRAKTPSAALNVAPPASTPGISASGMSPEGIKDPKIRAEYEKRIAENKKAIEAKNIHVDRRRAVDHLSNTLRMVLSSMQEKLDALKSCIISSQLPPESKAEILGTTKLP